MRKVTFAPGEYYHLYNRGVDKRKIFTREADYERFVTLLYACNGTRGVDLDEQGKDIATLLEKQVDRGEPLIDICAYVLMPNHFHVMVREINEAGIGRFMHKFGVAYTSYFNKKYDRTGSLFQGTYKANHASKDPYCSYVISYIHLNPVKLVEPKWKKTGITNRALAEKFLSQYKYSSYLDYCGNNRTQTLILNKASLPTFYTSAGYFKKEIQIWLNKG